VNLTYVHDASRRRDVHYLVGELIETDIDSRRMATYYLGRLETVRPSRPSCAAWMPRTSIFGSVLNAFSGIGDPRAIPRVVEAAR
jgi:hypothetical protein